VPAAIVTGSDSGIGKAIAVALARDGFDVGITWHEDEDGARSTEQEVAALGRAAEVRHLDLARLPGAAGVVDDLIETLGGVDVFVNNAGGTRSLSTSTARSCAPSGRHGRWSSRDAADASST
jgi:NAD(P)-dependent dehydrogenase (short-subunit alcohol dehydrogenase family)